MRSQTCSLSDLRTPDTHTHTPNSFFFFFLFAFFPLHLFPPAAGLKAWCEFVITSHLSLNTLISSRPFFLTLSTPQPPNAPQKITVFGCFVLFLLCFFEHLEFIWIYCQLCWYSHVEILHCYLMKFKAATLARNWSDVIKLAEGFSCKSRLAIMMSPLWALVNCQPD